jgi:hypothetical protein
VSQISLRQDSYISLGNRQVSSCLGQISLLEKGVNPSKYEDETTFIKCKVQSEHEV